MIRFALLFILGDRQVRIVNHALLGKWLWDCASEMDYLWKQVVLMKYGLDGGSVVLLESKLCMACAFGRVSGAAERNFLVKFIMGDGVCVSFGMIRGVGRLH